MKPVTTTYFHRQGCPFNRSVAVLLFLVLLWPGQLNAKKAEFDEYQVKAVFLYNLTNFVTWPETSFNGTDSPFIITILGKNLFKGSLKKLVEGEKIDNRQIQVKYIHRIEDISTTHLLFISSHYENNIESILQKTKLPGLLPVSDFSGFCSAGGIVNLLIDNQRIKLEINLPAAEKNKLKFSSKILRLAKLVEMDSQ